MGTKENGGENERDTEQASPVEVIRRTWGSLIQYLAKNGEAGISEEGWPAVTASLGGEYGVSAEFVTPLAYFNELVDLTKGFSSDQFGDWDEKATILANCSRAHVTRTEVPLLTLRHLVGFSRREDDDGVLRDYSHEKYSATGPWAKEDLSGALKTVNELIKQGIPNC